MAPGRKKSAKGVALCGDHRIWKVGDLVLAKVKGYPAWPAKVDTPENAKMCPRTAKVFVQYFGTKDYGYVSQTELSEFTPEVRAIVEKKARSCVKGPSHTSYRVAVKEICEFSDKLTVKNVKFTSEPSAQAEDGTEQKCDGAEGNREDDVLEDGEETKQEELTEEVDREEAGKLAEGNNEENTNDEAATVLVDFANTACLIETLTAETEGSSEGRKEEMVAVDTEVLEARVFRTFERRKKGLKITKDEKEKPEERVSTTEYVSEETEKEEKPLERISTKEEGAEKEGKPLERISPKEDGADTRMLEKEEKLLERLPTKEDGGDMMISEKTEQEEKPLERIFTKEDGSDTMMLEETEMEDTPLKRLSIEEHQGESRISGNTEKALERLSGKEDGWDTHVEKLEADKKLKHSNSDEAVVEKKRKPSSDDDLKSKHMKDENLPPLKRQRFREGETHKAVTKKKVASPDPAPDKAETNKIREAYEAAKQLKQRSASKDEAISTSLKFLGVAAQARKLSAGDSAVFMRPDQLRKGENHVSPNSNRDKMEAFQGMLETLTTTRECISRATRVAMECANKGFAKKVMDVIMNKLKNEQVHKKRLALLFLVDSMTQQNHHRTDGYAPLLEACISRFLLLVAPPDGPAENRKQCLKVASLWLERKIMEESLLNNAIARLEGRQRHPTDEMAVDEYASEDFDRDPECTSARLTDGVYSHVRQGDEELHSPPPLPESPPPSPPPRPPNSPSPSLLQQRGQ